MTAVGMLLQKIAHELATPLLRQPALLRASNYIYNRTSSKMKRRVYRLLAKLPAATAPSKGEWRIDLPNRKTLVVPLNGDWPGWDTALATLGHDQEIKCTYFKLLGSELRPSQFIDVSANYGSHSLLMLKSGICTLVFEPNPECVSVFERWAAANCVAPEIETVALDDSAGHASLDFPIGETWLGHISGGSTGVAVGHRRIRVQVRRLDDFRERLTAGQLLIKFDAEGAEPGIIRGAEKLISERRPWIIFECWPDLALRRAIFDALGGRFEIRHLPWPSGGTSDPSAFEKAEGTNFIAIPW